eukprot:jgi/Tetstr1/448118/TSEL_035414.t1
MAPFVCEALAPVVQSSAGEGARARRLLSRRSELGLRVVCARGRLPPAKTSASEEVGGSGTRPPRPCPVAVGQAMAARRQMDGVLGIYDDFAAALASDAGAESEAQAAADTLATRYLDEQLLHHNTFVTDNRDYKQVVLVGCATDTRPFRLPWFEGTVIYMLAPPEAHQHAAAALKELPEAVVPRGCLLRRVGVDLQRGEGMDQHLAKAGFQSDRLSVWGLQGLGELGLSEEQCGDLMLDISCLAAFGSQVCGELWAQDKQTVANLLAGLGLLGHVAGMEEMAAENGRLWDVAKAGGAGASRWLFRCEQQRLSLAQMDTYGAHVAAAEETDEDFFDNFS